MRTKPNRNVPICLNCNKPKLKSTIEIIEWTRKAIEQKYEKQIKDLEEKIKSLQQSVEYYGEHEEDCLYGKYAPIRDMPCTCGFLEAIGR